MWEIGLHAWSSRVFLGQDEELEKGMEVGGGAGCGGGVVLAGVAVGGG